MAEMSERDKKAKALYEKRLRERINADFESAPSDTYTESQDVVDSANQALKTGGEFNTVAKNTNEKEYRAFLRMSNEQKKKFIEQRGK